MSENHPKTYGVILAGGIGERMKSTTPKQYQRVAGKMVAQYVIETMLANSKIDEIIYMYNSQHQDYVDQLMSGIYATKPIKFGHGAKTRNETTCAALNMIDDDLSHVLIHDAVRPFMDDDIISRCTQALNRGYNAVDTESSVGFKQEDSVQ